MLITYITSHKTRHRKRIEHLIQNLCIETVRTLVASTSELTLSPLFLTENWQRLPSQNKTQAEFTQTRTKAIRIMDTTKYLWGEIGKDNPL